MKRRTAVDPRAPWVLGPWVLTLVGTGACGNACAPTTDRPVDAAGIVDALGAARGRRRDSLGVRGRVVGHGRRTWMWSLWPTTHPRCQSK